MNEYYLRNADYDRRLYTMCHELGHGLGLPHTDENFNNANLGNCLDYTDNPASNTQPGDINLERLRELYGDANSTTDGSQGTNNAAEGGGNARQLRRVVLRRYLYAKDFS